MSVRKQHLRSRADVLLGMKEGERRPAQVDENAGQRLRLQEARHRLKRSGTSLTQWARDHGFSKGLVSGVLAGRLPTRRGKSHDAAVLLGIKDGEIKL